MKSYKKMSYRDLQKEVFLLEHGFYDEVVLKYVNDKPSEIFGEELMKCVIPPFWIDGENLRCYLKQALTCDISFFKDLLSKARKAYFKEKCKMEEK